MPESGETIDDVNGNTELSRSSLRVVDSIVSIRVPFNENENNTVRKRGKFFGTIRCSVV